MFIVYKTTNLINEKFYIGVHDTCQKDTDNYLGSGIVLKNARNKYGNESFERETLFEFDNQKDAYEMEASIVDQEFLDTFDDAYNVALGGNGGRLGPHLEETKIKISLSKKGLTPWNKGLKLSKKYSKVYSENILNYLANNKHPNLGSKRMTNGTIDKFVHKKDIEKFLNEGWKLGSKGNKYWGTHDNPNLGRKCINNGVNKKYVHKKDIEKFLNEGWELGGLKKKLK